MFDASAPDRYHTVVFVKSYSSADAEIAFRLTSQGRRVVFDLCDNHFYNPYELPRYARARKDMLEMMRLAQVVTCSTSALAEVITAESGGATRPFVVEDIAECVNLVGRPSRAPVVELVWFGSHGSPNAPGGMEDLLMISEPLRTFATEGPMRLTVVSNNQPKFDRLIAPLPFPTRYVEWSEAAQALALAEAWGVLIPISINPFTRCKTHNRLTTALYTGIPVIATSIPSYRELASYCTLDDWAGGLRRLREEQQRERARAISSRPYIDRRWSDDAVARQWERALNLPGSSGRGGLFRSLWGSS